MISVIIPVLNEELLLPTLLSQLSPRLRERNELEVIVSDGGSTDGTCHVAESSGAHIIRHAGLGRQTIAEGRNAGAAAAQGDILVFLNGDVRLADPDRFFSRVEQFASEDRYVGASCAIRIFPEEERMMDRMFHGVYNRYIQLINIFGIGMGRGECHIVRRSLFDRVGGYNAHLVAGEDFDLFRRLKRHGKLALFLDLVVFESPRRFRQYGYGRILWDWIKNAFSVMLRNRSASTTWEPIR